MSDGAVDALRGLLTEYTRIDNLLGPWHLLAATSLHLDFIGQLLTVATGPVRPRLLTVGAWYTEFAGWLNQDAGQPQAAARWSDQAMDWAQEADDLLMISYVLMRKSNQASTAGDAARTLGLARAALRERDRLTPRARALALRQEARGHALHRDAAPCARALDDAAAQASLREDHGPDEHALTGYCTPEYIEMEAADCAMILGQPAQAVAIFEHGLSTWSADYQRDRGLNLARLATAHAANRDPERACATARDAITNRRDTGSARALALLHRLPTRLVRWSDLPAVADLRHALATLP